MDEDEGQRSLAVHLIGNANTVSRICPANLVRCLLCDHLAADRREENSHGERLSESPRSFKNLEFIDIPAAGNSGNHCRFS